MRDARPPFDFDSATAISKGGRDYQEDALVTDFSSGADLGFSILSDGMGGHAAGDIASKIVVTRVFSAFMFQRERLVADPSLMHDVLYDAAMEANHGLRSHIDAYRETTGMGATLLACAVMQDRLNWISVGDSPLFLFRDDELHQINEDHSLGPHIDLMVRSGAISMEEGENHPERNVLTSVLAGQNRLAQVDCPEVPFLLRAGDTIIVASDGLQYLKNDTISQILRDHPMARSADMANALMTALGSLNDPDLDNVTLSLIQVRPAARNSGVVRSSTQQGAPGIRTLRWPFARREAAVKVARRARERIGAMNGRSDDGD